MIKTIKNYIKRSWKEGTQIERGNILTTVFIGGPAHIFVYFFNTYIICLPYDNFLLRLIVSLACFSVYFYPVLPKKIKKVYFPFYWHLMTTSALTFITTFLLLKNNFNEVYLYWEIFCTFLLALYIPNWFIFTIDLILSVLAGILLFLYTTPVIDLNPDFNILGYALVLSFTMLCGMFFVYGNKSTWLLKQQNLLNSISGSIVHEIRNPLNAINLVHSQIKDLIQNPENITAEKLQLFDATISNSIKQANEIINIALNDLSNKPVKKDDFKYLNLGDLKQVVSQYAYSEDELKNIHLAINHDSEFYFKAIPERFTFVIYNLIKNALFYVHDYPNSVITIGCEANKTFKNKKTYNVIYIHDTGPGISTDSLDKIFESFYTSGKKGGTGLGLDFCKRTMSIFKGDIICESQYGNGKQGWTKFSLLFPVIPKDELESIAQKNSTLHLLLVDDQEINLMIAKRKIENSLKYTTCDTFLNANEAITTFKEKQKTHDNYHLILLDIQMPNISGIEVAKKIRKINKTIPIISLTSLSYEEFVAQIKKEDPKSAKNNPLGNFNHYLNKSVNCNILNRTITKFSAKEYDLSYLGNEENYIKYLQNKHILLADDEPTNLLITKRKFEQYGMKVDIVANGEELLNAYQNSLDDKNKSKYHIIITDINMPSLTGDEAAKQIRDIERKNNLCYEDKIPIIALSGNGTKEDVDHFMQCEMTDYFIKGNDPQILVRIVGSYLS